MTTPTVTKRSVIITGSTRGLGLELARGFAAKGWRIGGCGRSLASVEAISEELGEGHFFSVADVASDSSVAGFAAGALAELGAPDLLINNAALMNDPAPLWEVPAEQFDALTAVNINGTANIIRHFTPAMIERGSGVIVNLSSGWGRSTSPEVAPYCATKWAIEGLTAALAQELPDGLAAVALNPGVIDTDMLRQAWAEGAAGHEKPAAWAETAVPFLTALNATDNGRAITAP
jgi:NAD(P)-dependent dehydrogenase (short-subunit alcohol dehydrogenase family)